MSESPTEEINILIVDDNSKNIIAMQNILKVLPVNIHTAESGMQALKAAIRYQYAVIYLDVQMPEMDGYEVVKCLQQNVKTAEIPIVLITAIYDSKPFMIKGYDYGAIDYLLNPIEPEILLSKTKIFIKLFLQQKKLQQNIKQLKNAVSKDILTGLANRQEFDCEFARLITSCKCHQNIFALILLDLDDFKGINDSLGHDIGDRFLQAIARLLETGLEKSAYISRLGGDEFAVLATGLSIATDAVKIADKLLELFNTTKVDIDDNHLQVTTTIGIATYPFAGKSKKDIYKAADIALYRAKSKGKNTYEFFSKEIKEEHQRRITIESAMPVAIRKEYIVPHYQPIVDLSSEKIVGLETLARWNDPELGFVGPLEFISIAEQSNLIQPLGEYLIEKTLKDFSNWQENYPWLKLNLNVSPYQLLQSKFIYNLRQQVWDRRINIDELILEITESLFTGKHKELESSLNEGQKMGMSFAIDDFGTGYSSLSRLKTLPICSLKIDQSFIREVTTDKDDASIVKAIIALAEALELEVVAEGVETKEQANFLINSGCQLAQGYYYYKPMSAENIDKVLDKKKT